MRTQFRPLPDLVTTTGAVLKFVGPLLLPGVFALFCSLPPAAQAAADQSPVSLAMSVLERCFDKDIRRIYDLDLELLHSRFSGLAASVVPAESITNPEDRRSGAYAPGKFDVSANVQGSQLTLLALHEALGAAGYRDRHYHVSTTLAFACGSVRAPEDLHALLRWNFHVNGIYHVAGGATIVIGGGDAVAAEFRLELLRAFEHDLAKLEVLGYLADLEIEPTEEGVASETLGLRALAIPHMVVRDQATTGERLATQFPLRLLLPRSWTAADPAFKAAVLEAKELINALLRVYDRDYLRSPDRRVLDRCGGLELTGSFALGALRAWNASRVDEQLRTLFRAECASTGANR